MQIKIILTKIKNNVPAKIVSIRTDAAFLKKLDAYGIRPGINIKKKMALPGKGPVIITVSNTEIAIGYVTAEKILVEANGNEYSTNRKS